MVLATLTSGATPVAIVYEMLISNGSDRMRPAASIESNMARSFSSAITSTRQRGSKVKPSMSSPARISWPHVPSSWIIVWPFNGCTSAHSGFSSSTCGVAKLSVSVSKGGVI